jgi:hypothetical protein
MVLASSHADSSAADALLQIFTLFPNMGGRYFAS